MESLFKFGVTFQVTGNLNVSIDKPAMTKHAFSATCAAQMTILWQEYMLSNNPKIIGKELENIFDIISMANRFF